MAVPENIQTVIESLTTVEQDAVLRFVETFRAERQNRRAEFRAAAEEFMDEHDELMRLLAK